MSSSWLRLFSSFKKEEKPSTKPLNKTAPKISAPPRERKEEVTFGSLDTSNERPKPRTGLNPVSTEHKVSRRIENEKSGILSNESPDLEKPTETLSRQLSVVDEKKTSVGYGIEADAKTIAELNSFTGGVVTGTVGRFPLTERQRRYVALLDDGRMLVAKNHTINPDAMQAQQTLKRKGAPIVSTLLVDMETIRIIYENDTKKNVESSGRRNRSEGLQEMQKEVLRLIQKAQDLNASDIHIRVNQFEAKIFVRADGIMQQIEQMPSDVAKDLCNAAFNMADASDSTYKLYDYQGARISHIRTPLPERIQSIRLQFNPLPNNGRYMIARLLYKESAGGQDSVSEDVDSLGYNETHVQQIKKMRRKPFGINIISGPTGSGKSTTLQKALVALMREKRGTINVVTIEDPPEYIIEGAAQLPVLNATTDEERNEKFRQAISASLRSDPDIVMIGEIRDQASSNLAFAAAMTGHGVWASLHANDAVSILDRMRDQKVELYKLTDHTLVTGLIGQRLIRKLCPHCSVPFERARAEGLISENLASRIISFIGEERAQTVRASSGKSCGHPKCRGGYAGREVVAETLTPDSRFMALIREEKKEEATKYWLEKLDGMTMAEHALQKLVSGNISPQDMEEKMGDLEDIDRSRIEIVLGKLVNHSED